jgi:hypothetical protein
VVPTFVDTVGAVGGVEAVAAAAACALAGRGTNNPTDNKTIHVKGTNARLSDPSSFMFNSSRQR